MIQVGDTNGITIAAATMIYGWAKHITTAVTGTSRGVRGNATTLIASASGTMIGVEGRAGNGTSASASDGVALGTGIGVYGYFAGTATATVSLAIGVKAHLDIDVSGLTVTEANGVLINCQTGAATVSALYGLTIEHEAASGTADTMQAAIRIKCVNGNEPMTCIIDASAANGLTALNGDQYPMFKLPSASGKTYLSWDVSATAWVQTS
jgi:hypothetical protein